MTEKETAEALEAMIRENGKRPAAERIQDLIDAGLIDVDGRVYTEQLGIVQELLLAKGFGDINASHSGHVPGGVIILREKQEDSGRRAEAPFAKIRPLIAKAGSQEGLWASLEIAGHAKKLNLSRKKKTG